MHTLRVDCILQMNQYGKHQTHLTFAQTVQPSSSLARYKQMLSWGMRSGGGKGRKRIEHEENLGNSNVRENSFLTLIMMIYLASHPDSLQLTSN